MAGVSLIRPYDYDWIQFKWRSPDYARVSDKPTVDVSRPRSISKEQDWAMFHGTAFSGFCFTTINHFIGVKNEPYPYTWSLHSKDCAYFFWGMYNLIYMNWFAGKMQQGCLNVVNPRTKWAHGMVFMMGLFRLQFAWFFGPCMYFYTYEWLYTNCPGLKIRDPSLEGWKRPWEEGQSTFIARLIATLWLVPSYAIMRGSFRRTGGWWWIFMLHAGWWEWCRVYTNNGSTGFLWHEVQLDNDKHMRYGNLAPALDRKIDPDTHRPYWVADSEDFRISLGDHYDKMFYEGGNHDYRPASPNLCRVRNPWFNFQKMTQGKRDVPVRYKNDLWKMPPVLTTMNMAGVQDHTVADIR